MYGQPQKNVKNLSIRPRSFERSSDRETHGRPMTLNALGSKSAVDTILQCFRNNVFLNTEDTYTARETAEKCMMEDVIKESVSYSESGRDARMGYLTGQIAGRDASISRSLSQHPKKEYIFDPSDFRRLWLHEAIFKGFDGVGGPGEGLSQALLEGEGGFVF